ncbi:MAG: hypothetical protein V1492_03055 [Candidatus Micrarchaeota archaeon]
MAIIPGRLIHKRVDESDATCNVQPNACKDSRRINHSMRIIAEDLLKSPRGGSEMQIVTSAARNSSGKCVACPKADLRRDEVLKTIQLLRDARKHIEAFPHIARTVFDQTSNCTPCNKLELALEDLAVEIPAIMAIVDKRDLFIQSKTGYASLYCESANGNSYCSHRGEIERNLEQAIDVYLEKIAEQQKKEPETAIAAPNFVIREPYSPLFVKGPTQVAASIEADIIFRNVVELLGKSSRMQPMLAHEFIMICRVLKVYGLNTFVKLNKVKGDRLQSLANFKASGLAERWLGMLRDEDQAKKLDAEICLVKLAKRVNSESEERFERVEAHQKLFRMAKRSVRKMISLLRKYGENELTQGERLIFSLITC